MFERLKKLKQLYNVLQTKDIIEPPLKVLTQLPQKRLPDEVFNEIKTKKSYLPLKTLFYLYEWLKYETITQMTDGRFVINAFLPPMPGKGYERMFENLLSGRRLSPVSAYFAVTSYCSYDCWHCSYKNRSGEDLSFEQIASAIDQLMEIGTSIIGITGGEPTLRNDLVEIISKIGTNADTMLFTNGINLNDTLASNLKKAGLWAIAVSIDSDIPQVHNEKRANDKAYEAAIKAIELSKKHGFYTMIATVPDINILKDGTYKNIYNLAKKLSVDEYRLVEPMPTGRIFSCDDCLLSDELRMELKNFHKEKNKMNSKPKVCSFALVESGEYFGCCAGTMHLFIDSSGNVSPCDFTPLSFGNIKEMRLTDIWVRLNSALKLPRYNCFILENYKLIREYYKGNLPIPYEDVIEIFKKIPESDLPGYFKHVLIQNKPF